MRAFRVSLSFVAAVAALLVASWAPAVADQKAKLPANSSSANTFSPSNLPDRRRSMRPPTISLRPLLNVQDRVAALEALQFALSEVGDGATFVWHRRRGFLRGMVRPTASFRGADGNICRHVVYRLTVARQMKQIESIACRQNDGSWSISG